MFTYVMFTYVFTYGTYVYILKNLDNSYFLLIGSFYVISSGLNYSSSLVGIYFNSVKLKFYFGLTYNFSNYYLLLPGQNVVLYLQKIKCLSLFINILARSLQIDHI